MLSTNKLTNKKGIKYNGSKKLEQLKIEEINKNIVQNQGIINNY